MVYTYGIKEGRARDEPDGTDTGMDDIYFGFIPLSTFFMHGVHLREQGWPVRRPSWVASAFTFLSTQPDFPCVVYTRVNKTGRARFS